MLRNEHFIRTTVLLSVLAGVGILAPDRARACFCDCYYSADCGVLSWCYYTKCLNRKVNGKLKDGKCKFLGLLSADGDLPDATNALDLWLQAFEVSGGTGGGPPDATLVAQAQAVSLPPEKHETVRQIAIAVQEAYLGRTEYTDSEPHLLGYYTPPDISEGADCDSPFAVGDHGSVAALDACHLAVGAKLRQAMIGELSNPGMGEFEARMAEIPAACPTYVTFGRCQFPHPVEHDHEFPYADGLACLEAELGRAVQSILVGPMPTGACCLVAAGECTDSITESDCANVGGSWHLDATCDDVFVNGTCVPAVSAWGQTSLALLVLCAGTMVARRPKQAACK